MLLYVHRDRTDYHRDGEPRTDTSTSTTQLLSIFFKCCFTSAETVRTVRDGEPRTATSSFTLLLSSVSRLFSWYVLYRLWELPWLRFALIVGFNAHRDHMRSIRDGDRVPMNLSGTSSQVPRPAKTEKTVSYHQNMVFKGGGDLASAKQLVPLRNLLFQQPYGTT